MRRVDDHDICARHIRQHLVHRNFLSPLPPLTLHVRVAFLLFGFVHQFLAGHSVLAHVFSALPKVVDGANSGGNHHDDQQEINGHLHHQRHRLIGTQLNSRHQGFRPGGQKQRQD